MDKYSILIFYKSRLSKDLELNFTKMKNVFGSPIDSNKNSKHESYICIWDGCCHVRCDDLALNPIYYYEDDSFLIYSLDIEDLLEVLRSSNVTLELDNEYLVYYLYNKTDYITCPDSSKTIYSSIKKTVPGEYQIINNKLDIYKFYNGIVYDDSTIKQDLSYDLFREYIRHFFDDYFSSFNSIGISLSGGIDSSYLFFNAYNKCNKVFTYTNIYKKDILADENDIVKEILKNTNANSTFIESSDEKLINFDQWSPLPYSGWFESKFSNIASEMDRQGCKTIAFGWGPDELLGSMINRTNQKYVKHPFINLSLEANYRIQHSFNNQSKKYSNLNSKTEVNSLLMCNLIEEYRWLKRIFSKRNCEIVLPYYDTEFLYLLSSVNWREFRRRSKFSGKSKFLMYDLASELTNIDIIASKPATKGEVTDLFALSVMQTCKKDILKIADESILCKLGVITKKKLLSYLDKCFLDFNGFVYSDISMRYDYSSIFWKWLTMEVFLKNAININF